MSEQQRRKYTQHSTSVVHACFPPCSTCCPSTPPPPPVPPTATPPPLLFPLLLLLPHFRPPPLLLLLLLECSDAEGAPPPAVRWAAGACKGSKWLRRQVANLEGSALPSKLKECRACLDTLTQPPSANAAATKGFRSSSGCSKSSHTASPPSARSSSFNTPSPPPTPLSLPPPPPLRLPLPLTAAPAATTAAANTLCRPSAVNSPGCCCQCGFRRGCCCCCSPHCVCCWCCAGSSHGSPPTPRGHLLP
mmetsp:Transcript_129/g.266  ORF Transcript_129/g.266 Transcript_129/m.266 type:complete len:248 (-) Transcript_129:49-792(-)